MKNILTKLDRNLKAIYYKYKDKKDPPVPVNRIRKYLELEGVLDEDEDN